MYDAIVVGARCAGSPTAMLLARAGNRVLVLERARFPRDTLSTHYLHLPAVARLSSWGLLNRLKATGCPPLRRTIYESGGIRLDGAAPPYHGQSAAYSPRRQVLDSLLVEAASRAGAEVREGCTVTGLLRDASRRVCGVEYRDPHSGATARERATLVIGADGMRSIVARLVAAPFTVRDPRKTCVYYSYWTGLPAEMELYERPGRWVAAVPTHDEATLVVTYFPQAEFESIKPDPGSAYLESIRVTAPGLHRRLTTAQRVERLYGTGDQQNFFRQAVGDGWALVGDAGHHKDSITAQGITDAFYQAELLAERVAGPLRTGDRKSLDVALGHYERERDQGLAPHYQATLAATQLDVREERRAMLRIISKDQMLTNRYFAAFAGTIPLEELYTSELLAAL